MSSAAWETATRNPDEPVDPATRAAVKQFQRALHDLQQRLGDTPEEMDRVVGVEIVRCRANAKMRSRSAEISPGNSPYQPDSVTSRSVPADHGPAPQEAAPLQEMPLGDALVSIRDMLGKSKTVTAGGGAGGGGQLGKQRLRLIDLFSTLDADKSGGLDRGEMGQLLAKCNIRLAEDAFELFYSTLDEDGDETVSFKEFARAVRHAHFEVTHATSSGAGARGLFVHAPSLRGIFAGEEEEGQQAGAGVSSWT